ncbi:MAG TPA: sodium:proton antiporter NhaD, partial [Saprospiraceae bacterium]|nr:sodium:proton antiporter NhaD [Saprospiraceae bacterium]
MAIAIVIAFILGYIFIALEHPVGINKAATALLTGVVCWLILALAPYLLTSAGTGSSELITGALFEHLGSISEILFFLLGAMTIVELMDAHNGFRVITDRITTSDQIKLLWILCWVTFFLSAVLDNMTTTIIMCALIRKLVKTKEDVWVMGGFVIIAANAGGAWSPIGDVTTIMLWIGGQVSSLNIIRSTFLASMVSLIVPLIAASFFLRKRKMEAEEISLAGFGHMVATSPFEQKLLFVIGCLGLLAVPAFKAITHLPPYMGVLLSLGLLWVVTEWIHRKKPVQHKHELSVGFMLHRIDTTSILFFLGILLAVGAL